MSDYRIGDEVYIHGIIDEIRKDTIIIKNEGGYFETVSEEIMPSAQPEIIRCEECRWGREVCGNIECFVDSNLPPEYHGYEWFCPNGERRTDE